MKALFLDCDGVLNCKTSNFGLKWPLDPNLVYQLKKIIEATGCKVVLSSSWRHTKEGIEAVNNVLSPYKLIGCTTRYSSSSKHGVKEEDLCRGHNIADWLDEHPGVEKFAILDDSNEDDFLPSQIPNFFKTDWQTGLTEEIAEKIISHFNA